MKSRKQYTEKCWTRQMTTKVPKTSKKVDVAKKIETFIEVRMTDLYT